MMLRALLLSSLCCAALHAQPATDTSTQEVLKILKKHRYDVDRDAMSKAVAEAMVKSADPSARALDARSHQLLEQERAGTFLASGIQLEHREGALVVSRVLDNSPARKAGVKPGETLTAIDGKDLATTRLPAVLQQLRGSGSITLSLSADDQVRELEIKRAPLPLPVIAVREDFPGELGYLKINGIYGDAAEQVTGALKKWADEKRFGVLIDLRDANGADLQAAADIASLFGKENDTLFELRDRGGRPLQTYKAKRGGPIGLPAMVLVNQSTRGAAEMLAVAMGRSVRGAMLIGENTPGDLGLREAVPLKSGLHLYLATRTVILPDQQQFDGSTEVEPDIALADRNLRPVTSPEDRSNKDFDPSARQLRERSKRDAILRRAIDVMQGLKALNIRTLGAAPKK